MNTLEIFCKLLSIKSRVSTNFDVLAKDQLINYEIKPPFGLCVNTSDSNEEGSHWVAFYLGAKCNKMLLFFSFVHLVIPLSLMEKNL